MIKFLLAAFISCFISAAHAEPQKFASRFEVQETRHIVISHGERKLYLFHGRTLLKNYDIAVGRDGFEWFGKQTITRKTEWPDWRPPASMIKRQPYLPRYMAGGPGNPLGARALYLGSTEYRIHGSNQPQLIGQAVSSGCFRMRNRDIVELYGLVEVGMTVTVRR